MVVFSPELFSIQNYGGVTRCMIELMRELDLAGYDWHVWAGRHGNEPLDLLGRDIGDPRRIEGQLQPRLPGRLYGALVNEGRFSRYLRQARPAVCHRSQYPAIDMAPRGQTQVTTLHDMWTERPDASRGERLRSGFKRRALEASAAIVAISDHSRRMMLECWPHLADRVQVIHHGVRPVSPTPTPCTLEWPFFLYVGAREARKNFPLALQALAASPTLAPLHLVCVGGGAFDADETAMIGALGLNGRVHQRGANDDELAGLYEAAVALLYPSTFEGFGLPLLEAMLHGCPVISSPLSCMPEIGGDAALYADAQAPEAWSEHMAAMAFDTAQRAQVRHKGAQQAQRFTWARSAQQHIDLYRRLS